MVRFPFLPFGIRASTFAAGQRSLAQLGNRGAATAVVSLGLTKVYTRSVHLRLGRTETTCHRLFSQQVRSQLKKSVAANHGKFLSVSAHLPYHGRKPWRYCSGSALKSHRFRIANGFQFVRFASFIAVYKWPHCLTLATMH